ncbi:MAG TPA: 6-phospho-beta-glucosidase, partial [Feifaniaceae bacterium]|nr:6-phospho-beta-glucosidase [Feifaniaceae bacterium]
MAKGLKLAVIGGGSTYTPELMEGLLQNYERFPVETLVLADIPEGERKLEAVGGLIQRMAEKSGLPMRVDLTFSREEALYGADFVSTQLRVGLLKARALDESIPLKYGMIGQETTGPGGMMKALRTIPVMLDIAEDMRQLCPDAWLLNFTNPSGMVTQAVNSYTDIRAIGLCNSPIGMVKWVCGKYGVDESRVSCEFAGLNHLNWVTGITVDGEEKLPELIGRPGSYTAPNVPDDEWNPNFLRALGAIPSYYL